MSKTRYLLGTSAILTLLEDEEGAQRVETLLRREEVLFPFLALLETYHITLQEQTEDLADQRYALTDRATARAGNRRQQRLTWPAVRATIP